MAQRVITQYVSDLSGEELGADGKTVKFAYLGAEYEIDLSQAEADEFGKTLSTYLQAARRVGGRKQSGSANGSRASRDDLANVRAWAKEQGHKVSVRGRIAQDVIDAYDAAQK
ncbi:histone-like nucleoid-structuring protein Lsr2 [Serinicoccus sp. LYQ131]|uniref:histone-like nucleoid-structuring protein Lsr2 n=1 Tax=Serinicoccus sp. LYQ131 TaxID=3378797 RepID=UPI0038534601